MGPKKKTRASNPNFGYPEKKIPGPLFLWVGTCRTVGEHPPWLSSGGSNCSVLLDRSVAVSRQAFIQKRSKHLRGLNVSRSFLPIVDERFLDKGRREAHAPRPERPPTQPNTVPPHPTQIADPMIPKKRS